MRKFATVTNGYSKEEVNGFVVEVTKEYETMLNKLKTRDREVALLKEESLSVIEDSTYKNACDFFEVNYEN